MQFNFIDTHCHVHFQAYKDDMDEVVKRSLEEGVAMITIGTQSTTSKNGIALAEKYDGVWATIGLHPNHLHKQEFFDDNELPPEQREVGKIKTRSEDFDPEYYRELVKHPKVVAIGEFGLDYYRIPPETPKDKLIEDQKAACQAQLKFASEFDKPVVIHCRPEEDDARNQLPEAHRDQADLIEEEINAGGLKKRGVIHSYTGSAKEAERYRSLGFYVGINGILFFSKKLQQAVKEIPLEQIVVETDAPYLTPPPNRGKRNEPRFVKFVAEKIAELKGVNIDKIAEATNANAVKLFNLE